MELKRYVRMNNRIFKFDENKDDYHRYSCLIDKATCTNEKDIKEHKHTTADTILELAQVGDLVKGHSCIYLSEITEILDDEIQTLFHLYWKNEITELWVRQDDDTFKRYKV